MIGAPVTHETSWFRDPASFELLRQKLAFGPIPTSVWSAGCAYGQEIYSIAMLLAEANADLTKVRLLGTDISVHAIERAQRGRYLPLEINRGLTPKRIERFFTRCGREWQIDERLRRAVEFRMHDLRSPIGEQFDLILCRNVLMYFAAETQKSAAATLARSLRPGGQLLLGAAELSRSLKAACRVSANSSR